MTSVRTWIRISILLAASHFGLDEYLDLDGCSKSSGKVDSSVKIHISPRTYKFDDERNEWAIQFVICRRDLKCLQYAKQNGITLEFVKDKNNYTE